MNCRHDLRIHMIPIDQIIVPNPRQRGRKKFTQIIDNIGQLGLKKPITVAPGKNGDGKTRYNLVCGQGRLEAYQAHGQTEIPAFIIDAPKEDLLLMSLIENLARRQHSTVELAKEITALKDRGYSCGDIATKTGLDTAYVQAIVRLLSRGEERLLQAVEKHRIPLSVAMTIANSSDKAVQQALTDAYEKKELRGKALMMARRLIEERRSRGKSLHSRIRKQTNGEVSSDHLLRTYQQETARLKIMVQRAKICETRLLFSVSAIKRLFQEENFVNLLRAESLDSVPQYLAAQLNGERDHHD